MILALTVSFSAVTEAAPKPEMLFDGYSKVIMGGQHVGYVISRYQFDAKKNLFLSDYFLKTGKAGGEITESLKAVATADLAPVSYEYTSVIGKETKTIDAKFKNGKMSAVVKTNGKVSRIEKQIPKGTFLSTFLVYLMLKSKEGLKSESKYEYQAIAEEDGSIQKGQALVGKEEVFNGFKVFKILNTFKGSKFLSYVNDRGEVLGTSQLGQDVGTELVAHPADATKDQAVSDTLLSAIFGSVPKGDNNIAFRSAKGLTPAAPGQGKFEGAPQGQGIEIKAGGAPRTKSSPAKGN
jgi:hypothetical protein